MKYPVLSLLISAFPLLFAGCMDEIGELVFPTDSQPCVNAIFHTGGRSNRLWCSRLEGSRQMPVLDAEVRVLVNGSLEETVTGPASDQGDYVVTAEFRPGDEVRIEVTSSEFGSEVWAEARVPEPVTVTRCEVVREMQMSAGRQELPFNHVRLDLEYHGEARGRFRLQSRYETRFRFGRLAFGERDTDLIACPDSVGSFYRTDVQLRDDLALKEGYVNADEEDPFGFDVAFKNHYRLFSDTYFVDSRYTLSYFTYEHQASWRTVFDGSYGYWTGTPDWLSGHRYRVVEDADGQEYLYYDKELTCDLVYDVYSLSDEEFRYLKGRGMQVDIAEIEPLFIDPVILPANVHGALGFFAVETCSTGRFSIPIADE